jgi:uncharacterized protein (DUF302 family)
MLVKPSFAIDLPFKILVGEDVEGNVWVSYNSPPWHNLPARLLQNITVGRNCGEE